MMSSTTPTEGTTRCPWHAAAAALALLPLLAIVAGCSADDSAGSCCETPGPSRLDLVLESSSSPLTGEVASFRAAVDAHSYLVTGYAWQISGPTRDLDHSVDSADGSRVSFGLDDGPGTYTIHCHADVETGYGLDATATLTAASVAGAELLYTARIYPPPATGAPPMDWEQRVVDADRTGLLWQVKEGIEVQLEVRQQQPDDAGELLPSFVRLTSADQPDLPRDLFLEQGSAKVRLSGAFDALLIPETAEVAPAVRAGLGAATVAPTWVVSLDRGELVSGTVRDSAAPIEGAVVTLQTRDDDSGLPAPSTVGRSSADGSFSLRARHGGVRLTVVPPRDSVLPVAVVQASELRLDGPAEGWLFTYAPPQLAAFSGKVTLFDGETPASQAAVMLRSKALADVGQLQVGSTSYAASGHYQRTLATDDAGTIIDPATSSPMIELPRGSYEVVLLPGPGADPKQGQAVTEVQVDIDEPALLRLSSRVALSGAVVGYDGRPARARVSARGSLGTFVAESDDEGRFSLDVDADQTYALVVRPLHADLPDLGPLLMPSVAISGDKRFDQLVLPRAVTLSGQIKTEGNAALAGALIRIWCSSSNCISHDIVDETRSGSDGSFILRVPRP